jgi:hypothetical protein
MSHKQGLTRRRLLGGGASTLIATAFGAVGCGGGNPSLAPGSTTDIASGFNVRRDSAFANMNTQTLTYRYVSPNILYVRPQSYDRLSFAMGCFWKGVNLTAANAAIAEHNAAYLDSTLQKNGKTIGEGRMFDGDSFYWAIGLLFECIELFGSQGSRNPSLLTQANEDISLDMLRRFADRMSKADAHLPGTVWNVRESENLHVQLAYCLWHTMKLLDQSVLHQNQPLQDGRLPKAHFDGWTAWIKEWIREHAKKGLFIEYGGDEYNATTLKGLYVIAAFGNDEEIKLLALSFIEVFWASWAQDHTKIYASSPQDAELVRGGSQARIYPDVAQQGRPTNGVHQQHDPIQQLAYYYAGLGSAGPLEADVLMMLATGIEPHAITTARLLEGNQGYAPFEVTDRAVGLFDPTRFVGRELLTYYPVDTQRTFLRYLYKTPEYSMGSILSAAYREWEWTMISSQNRWAGLVCDSHVDARVCFYSQPTRNDRSYNAFWSVQKRGAMIVQKLYAHPTDGRFRFSKDAGALRVWVAASGQTQLEKQGQWVFASYGQTWVAIGFSGGAYTSAPDPLMPGEWLSPIDELTPMVLQVSRASDLSYEDFKLKMLAYPLPKPGATIQYISLQGDVLELPLNWSTYLTNLPKINGSAINFSPKMGLDGPCLKAEWNESKIKCLGKNQRIEYDFDLSLRQIVSGS